MYFIVLNESFIIFVSNIEYAINNLHVSIVVGHHFLVEATQELFEYDGVDILAELVEDEPVAARRLGADVGDLVGLHESGARLQQVLPEAGGEDHSEAVGEL